MPGTLRSGASLQKTLGEMGLGTKVQLGSHFLLQ